MYVLPSTPFEFLGLIFTFLLTVGGAFLCVVAVTVVAEKFGLLVDRIHPVKCQMCQEVHWCTGQPVRRARQID